MGRWRYLRALCLTAVFGAAPVWGGEMAPIKRDHWGLIMGYRGAQVPYNLDGGDLKYDLVPRLYYEHERFYLRGTHAGYVLQEVGQHDLRLVSKYRFYDYPHAAPGFHRDDGLDSGIAWAQRPWEGGELTASFLSDLQGRLLAELRAEQSHVWGPLEGSVYGEWILKSRRYNRRHFGLGRDGEAGADTLLGVSLWANPIDDFSVFGKAEIVHFGAATRDLPTIRQASQKRFYLGAGSHPRKVRAPDWSDGMYYRFAVASATPSNRNDILLLRGVPDRNRNRLLSLFVGYPLADRFLGLPLEVYFQPGVATHLHSPGQRDVFVEGVAALKLYYRLPTDRVAIRIGIGEGLSYAQRIPDVEQREMDRRKMEASHLLNYLDDSIDVDLRSWIGMPIRVGWYLHHRSGIFSTSSVFGRVRGGSNYNALFVLWTPDA